MPKHTSKIQTHIDQQTLSTLVKYYQQGLDIPVASLAHLGEMVFHDYLEHLITQEDVKLVDSVEEQEELMIGLILASRTRRRYQRGIPK